MDRHLIAGTEYRLARHRGKYCVSYIDDTGTRRRPTLGTTDFKRARTAFGVYVAGLSQAASTPRAGSTTDDVFRAYIADRKVAGRYPEKMDFNRAAVNPVFGHLLPRSIRREDCLAHIVRRREAGISDGTIWTELTTLRTALNHAVRMGWIEKAPYITAPPKPDPREHHLSRAE